MKSKLNPELIAALFPSTVGKKRSYHPQEIMRELDRYGLSYTVSKGITARVELNGHNEEALKKCRAILAETPEIEAWLILYEAAKDTDLLEAIKERAAIRWCEGLSDSLYMAVLGNLKRTDETVVKKRKPQTDWDAELDKYR